MKLSTSMAALLAASVFAFSSPAFAADLGYPNSDQRADLYEPAPAQGVRVNWSGVYVGGAIGYGNANHDLTANEYFKDYCGTDYSVDHPFENFHRDDRESQLDADGIHDATCAKYAADHDNLIAADSREIANLDGLNSTGIVGDIRLGYDQQMGRFLLGAFGSYGFSNMDADGAIADIGSFKLERGDDWSVGARAGVLVNNSTLLYALAAYTQTEYDLSVTDGANTLSKTTTFDGITVGGGIEFAVSNNVFFGIEGTHTFYGEETIFDDYKADANVGTSVDDDLSETKVLGTLKIKLNSF